MSSLARQAISLQEIKASNAKITASTSPQVAVFVGATAGIGKATLIRLIAQKTPLKVYLVGRNAAKQQAFIKDLRASNEQAEIIFVEAQVSLMSEVRRVCDEIKAKEMNIDLLFLSAGFVPFAGREGRIN
jgi:NADP-dependent 3-hydroxy acid dehydrogenase YdfG